MRTSQLSAAGLKAEGGQSGTLAAHELISRVVKKYLYVWVSQDTCAVPQLKNLVWAGREPQTSELFITRAEVQETELCRFLQRGGQACWAQPAVPGRCGACCA